MRRLKFSRSQIKSIAGGCLLLSLLGSIVVGFNAMDPQWPASSLAWVAGLALFAGLPLKQRGVIGLLLLGGVLAWWGASHYGMALDWQRAIGMNQSLIALLIGVNFLRLVALPSVDQQESLPVGRAAFERTWFGLLLFGAVINLSVVLIFGDRLNRAKPLDKAQYIVLTRAFPSAAFWSPLFAAFAAALVYAPQASLAWVWAAGMPMALAAWALSRWQLQRDASIELSGFQGYPVHFQALFLPVLLAAMVLTGHAYLPQVPVIILIAASALLLVFLILTTRHGPANALRRMLEHSLHHLPAMYGELILFLAAGVFGSGLAALVTGAEVNLNITALNGAMAAMVLGLMLLAAVLGAHPVISMAVVGAWLASVPVNHSLLAVTFLMAWSIGVSVSPLSGMNLALQGRYRVSGRQLFAWNKGYALGMWAIGSVILVLLDQVLTGPGFFSAK